MLTAIHIENFAIVEHLELHLTAGLIIISGETGAGKSILMDALAVVLGERAESSIVRHGCDSARINAVFTTNPSVQQWLQENDLQGENPEECVVRRIIHLNNRSRAYINDQPVSSKMLQALGEQLVHIHGQHAHQALLRNDRQRDILDAAANDTDDLLKKLQANYQQWKTYQQEWQALNGLNADREARLSLLRYQVQELEAFELTDIALTELNTAHNRLTHAQKLLAHAQQAVELIEGEENDTVLNGLNRVVQLLTAVLPYDAKLTDIINTLESAAVQTQEAASELRHYLDKVELDPAQLSVIEKKISQLQDLARKHKVKFKELPTYFQQITQQLQTLESHEKRAAEIENQLKIALNEYKHTAQTLYIQRLATATQLAQAITFHLKHLAMPNGQLEIKVTHHPDATPTLWGLDTVEFLVSTNIGQIAKPLQKIVSGGELSRISLAIQVITAQTSGVPTLVFDEVDVGIGGGTAEIVGQLLRQLGMNRQVLCITHLPQVACQGHIHLQVRKTHNHTQTFTQIELLNEKQRVEEIARMLGGIEITPQTLAYAQEMLQWRNNVLLHPAAVWNPEIMPKAEITM